jgi:hypothetical protein
MKVSKWELIGLRIWHITIAISLLSAIMIFIPHTFMIACYGLVLAGVLFFIGYLFMIYGCTYGRH